MDNIKLDIIKENDIEQILEIQNLVYTEDLIESKESFLSMINKFQEGCIYININNLIVGYFITHSENINNLPPNLNSNYNINMNIQIHNIYYFHDLAVHPLYRNLQIGSILIYNAVKIAIINKFNKIALTAVQNADKYWNKFGFVKININNKNLLSYGSNAILMITSINIILNKLYNLGFPSLIYVYIIQLKNNKFYVIKSNKLLESLNINSEEFNNIEWLYYNPIINLQELTKIRIFETNINEDEIVLELMQKYGINNVRGGNFKTLNISVGNTFDIINKLKKELNKCYLCAKNHQVTDCKLKNKYDYQYLIMHFQ